MSGRVTIDGKLFASEGRRFNFRGVTYGTFQAREDGAFFPERNRLKQDFSAMRTAGFNVIRTYTVPPEDALDLAADWGLHLLSDVFYPDWRYLVGCSRRDRRRVASEARRAVHDAARKVAGNDQVLALSLGNEVPADVLRWLGADVVAGTIRELVDVVREVDADLLVTYANYPTAEYLPLESLDFLTFNVFLERQEDFRRYLTRLHHLAGDRPLVLGEVGLDAGADLAGERRQCEAISWLLETAIERGVAGTNVFCWTDEWWVGNAPVEGWHFGLTRADRSPRPALSEASAWNNRTVADLDFPWPSISVVICAYNAASTLDECLRHTCALDYPGLEIVVVDDGSTDSTADIARRHPRAILRSIDHAGLSVARNEGFRAATGELIAYLDSDAYPSAEWPYFLALGLDGPTVGGVGGPNFPPVDDSIGAQVVARAPGGPVHVLMSDDRAEHLPGCNMAFWKRVLEEVGGFDPIYTAAGDDVDLCWRVLDRDWDIGFHPAAWVWHHRRGGLRAYLRQQRGYGRSEALVAARNPDRFTAAGTARWRGRIYNSVAPAVSHQRIYRGAYGAAAYQSVYQGGGYLGDLIHQVGIPVAVLVALSAPLAAASLWLGLPALCALAFLAGLFGVDSVRAEPPRSLRSGRHIFRLRVAAHHVLQPVLRAWGRSRSRRGTKKLLAGSEASLPEPVRRAHGGVVVFSDDRPREELAAGLVDELRRAGARVVASSGWDDFDARILASAFVRGDLLSSSHPVGFVQVRVRRQFQWHRLAVAVLLALLPLTLGVPQLSLLLVIPTIAETIRGTVRLSRIWGEAVPAGVRNPTP